MINQLRYVFEWGMQFIVPIPYAYKDQLAALEVELLILTCGFSKNDNGG